MDEQEIAPAELISQRRTEYWSGVGEGSAAAGVWHASDVPLFSGRVRQATVGELHFMEVTVLAPSVVHHVRSNMSRANRSMFYLKVQLDGESIARQDGREAALSPGDFTLCDSRRPYTMICNAANRVLALRLPAVLLQRHVVCADKLTAVPMSGTERAGELLSTFVRTLWARSGEAMDAGAASHVTHAVLSLIASAYERVPHAKPGRPSMAAIHRSRIQGYVEQHLTDQSLSPLSIAEACRIKSRYLRKLYESEDETLMRYILRRRLEECAKLLTAETHRNLTVTEIAFAYGFNSVTHFGRVFRERYGLTPSMYRERNSHSGNVPEQASGTEVESSRRTG